MKAKIIFISLIFCFVWKVNAQIEFAPVGAKWYFLNEATECGIYTSIKDTVISGKHCKVIVGLYDSPHYLYQEDNKVYLWFNESFYKIFDFTVEKDDSVQLTALTIDEILTLDCKVEDVSYTNSYGEIPLKHVVVSFQSPEITEGSGWYSYTEKIGAEFIIPRVNVVYTNSNGLMAYEDNTMTYVDNFWAQQDVKCDYPGKLNSNNNTIVNDNSSWSVLGSVVCPECPVWTQYVYFEGDSIFQEYIYKKVFSCDDKLRENIKYEGLIREQNKKTYFIPNNFEKEYLMYDFSLEEGMNFEYVEPQVMSEYEFPLSLCVKKIDLVEINGVQLKQIQFSNSYVPTIDVTWVEKIGSLAGLFYPCGVLNPGANRTLLCYFQNNELFYKNPVYSECYYDRAEDITSVKITKIEDFYVFPNPVDDLVTVSSTNTVSRIDIFDISGKQIYSLDNKNTVDVSSFPKGLYLFKVYDTEGEYSLFKIIKK
jgi:hypothetical protein